MKLEQHSDELDQNQTAKRPRLDATQPARPVRPDSTQPVGSTESDATQPAHPVPSGTIEQASQFDVTQPARPVRSEVSPAARPAVSDTTQSAHAFRPNRGQLANPSPFDVTQPSQPVRLDISPPTHPAEPDVTQPTRPVWSDTTRPARPIKRRVAQATRSAEPGFAPRARPAHPPMAQGPKRPPQIAPLPRRPVLPARSAPRRRRYLLPVLGLALIASLLAVLLYGLLLLGPPTNVLILGVDRRPNEGNAVRTDTMLLLHADTANRRLALLSIPRDLWVTIPGRGEARINSAHVYGELEAPGSGPTRAAEAVSYNFGVTVDHYLRLDFDAFRAVIDAAGGVDIDVPAAIFDDAYPTEDYGYMRIEIPAGQQRMDGETALQYARSRHASSDFDRAARQQQILVALIKKLTSPKYWYLIPRVYTAFQNAVETDLSFRELAALVLAWQRAGDEAVERIVIDRTLTTPFRTAQGAAVLRPRWDLIHPLLQARFAQ